MSSLVSFFYSLMCCFHAFACVVCFVINPHLLLFLRGVSFQEKDDWIGAIGRAIVQASSTYQGDANNGDSDSDEEYNYR